MAALWSRDSWQGSCDSSCDNELFFLFVVRPRWSRTVFNDYVELISRKKPTVFVGHFGNLKTLNWELFVCLEICWTKILNSDKENEQTGDHRNVRLYWKQNKKSVKYLDNFEISKQSKHTGYINRSHHHLHECYRHQQQCHLHCVCAALWRHPHNKLH